MYEGSFFPHQSFYMKNALGLGVPIRADTPIQVMYGHHVATLGLVSLSYFNGWQPIGQRRRWLDAAPPCWR